MCGALPLEYEPGEIPDLEQHRAAFEVELADRFSIRDWADLEVRYDGSRLAELTDGLPPEEISAAGFVVDGVVYL